MSQDDPEELEARLEQLGSQISAAMSESRNRTAVRLSGEARRLAKVERQLGPYLRSLYLYGEAVDEFAPRDCIEATDLSVEAAMRIVLTGGLQGG